MAELWRTARLVFTGTTNTMCSASAAESLRYFLGRHLCGHTRWEDNCKLISWQSFSQPHTSQPLPLHNFPKSRGNKQKKLNTHTQSYHHLVAQSSKHEILACTVLAATDTDTPLSLLQFYKQSEKGNRKQKHRPAHTLAAGASAFWQQFFPTFISDGMVPGWRALWGCHPGNATGSPTSATVNSQHQGLPLPHGCREMLPLEPDSGDSRAPTRASQADVGWCAEPRVFLAQEIELSGR